VAELFSDLDGAIDSRADDHEKAEKDPGFTGFHRIEYALWVQNSTQGLAPVADKLLADVQELQKRLATLTFPPDKVVGGAAALMEEVAATKISGEEDRYSHTDLWDFQANFEGAYKIVQLLHPLIVKENKAFAEKTDANFKVVFDTLAKYKTADGGFETYSKLTDSDRKLLAGRVNVLAEDLSKLRGMMGLN
jgi:iron uptake system component EfeO